MAKKTKTPHQQIKRGKTALMLIALMSIVYLTALIITKDKKEKNTDIVENIMNEKIDSLFMHNGYQGAIITDAKPYRLISILTPIPEEDTLFLLKTSLEIKNLTAEETAEMKERIKKLQNKVEQHKNSKSNTSTYYNRRIYFKADGNKYFTGIQTLDTLLKNSELKHIIDFKEVTIPEY